MLLMPLMRMTPPFWMLDRAVTSERADDDEFNRILWRAVKGNDVPYPGVRRSGVLEWARSR